MAALELGPLDAKSYAVIFVVVITVLAWALSNYLELFFGDLGVISIVPMVMLFGSGLLTKQDLLRLDWSLVVLLGGGFCLGGAVQQSGALNLVANSLNQALLGASADESAVVFNLVIGIVSNFVSHSVTAVTLIPVIAQTAAGGPVAATVMSAITSDSGACVLPISSLPNLIVSAATDDQGVTCACARRCAASPRAHHIFARPVRPQDARLCEDGRHGLHLHVRACLHAHVPDSQTGPAKCLPAAAAAAALPTASSWLRAAGCPAASFRSSEAHKNLIDGAVKPVRAG